MRRVLVCMAVGVAALAGLLAGGEGAAAQAPMPRIIVFDAFDDPAIGIMPRASSTAGFRYGYTEGVYRLDVADPAYGLIGNVFLPDTYDDATVAVSARVVGDADDRAIMIQCRRGADVSTGYRFTVYPDIGEWFLHRLDNGERTPLDSGEDDAVNLDNRWNRYSLTCAGTRITATVNGVAVASVRDGTYRRGEAWIGVDRPDGLTATAEFDELIVTQAGEDDRPVLAADTFADAARGMLPASTRSPQRVRIGYIGGEYQLATLEPDLYWTVSPIGDYFDANLAVDARIVGDVRARFVAIACRGDDDGAIGLHVYPEDGTFTFVDFTDGGETLFEGRRRIPSAAIRRGNAVNRIGLSCELDSAAAVINGEIVAVLGVSEELLGGEAFFGAGAEEDSGLTVDARFDNFALNAP